MSYSLNKTLQMCTVKTESGLGYKSSQVRVRVRVQQPPLQVQIQLSSVAKLINSLKVPINMFFFSNKIHTVEEIANEADETLFLKMQCKQHCLNPTVPPRS